MKAAGERGPLRTGTVAEVGEAGLPFFSSDGFLEAFAEHYFPGGRPTYVRCEDVTARVVMHRGGPVNSFWHFRTYLEPLPPAVAPDATRVPYLTEVARYVTTIDEQGPPGAVPAVFVRLSDFDTWEDYAAFAVARKTGASFYTLDRHDRRLRRKHGSSEFRLSDDPAHLETILRWKNDQLRRRGQYNRWEFPENVRFLVKLQDLGLLEVSTLRAGDQVIAGHVWNLSHGRSTDLITAYDPAFRDYSPGNLLLVRQLRRHFDDGVQEFDFLRGREPQKLAYGTHIRWLSNVGREPRLDHWRRRARIRAAIVVNQHLTIRRSVRKVELGLSRLRHRLTPQ